MSYLRNNSERAKNAIILIWVVIILEFLNLISSVMQWNLLTNFINGEYVSDEAFDFNDKRESFFAVAYLVGIILSGIFFIKWFRRAYFNLIHFSKNALQTDGWAAGSWFTPIINLYRPYQMMQELFTKTKFFLRTKDVKFKESKNIVSLWWAAWIVSNLISTIANRGLQMLETVEGLRNVTAIYGVSYFFGIVSGFLLIKIIEQYRSLENLLQGIRIQNDSNVVTN